MLEYQSGSLFGGRYEVLKCIGAGGMGAVYLATDSRYRKFPVALKVLYPGIIKTPELRERFRNEIVASYRVLHRNVVRAYEYFDEENMQAYVMEYVEGEDLHSRIKEGAAPAEEVLNILYQAAGGLEAIHTAGIVHRDLKPENILLTNNGLVKIADFGVARLKSANVTLTQVGAMVGTPKYFSPEYIELGECDHRGDIYALGVIGYELLTGTSPFKAKSRTSLMVERFENSIRPIRKIASSCPPALARVVEKAMALSVNERYQNAREMRVDLGLLKKNEPPIYAVETAPRRKPVEVRISKPGSAKSRAPQGRWWTHSAVVTLCALMLISSSLAAAGYAYIRRERTNFIPVGSYCGFVSGLGSIHAEQELRISKHDDGRITVVLSALPCGEQTVGAQGRFECENAVYHLNVEHVNGSALSGTINRDGVAAVWSAVRSS